MVIDSAVHSIAVREDGLIGSLFLPASTPPYSLVITVGGSGPGIFAAPALPFASHGIATLALAYFGIDALLPELKRIPLEYFGPAITWLSECEAVRQSAIGIAGYRVGANWLCW